MTGQFQNRTGSFPGLAPVLHAALLSYAGVSSAARPEPAAGSDLAEDDDQLQGFPASALIRTGLDTAIEHLHALAVLFIDAKIAHPHVPMTLLRASLEDAAQAVWLLAPADRDTRLLRALRVWHRDFGDRAGFERIDPQGAPGRTGRERQDQMVDRTLALSLDVHAFDSNLTTTAVITEASAEVGLSTEAARFWSLSSGLAHGRYWPHLSGGITFVDAAQSTGGYTLTVEASEEEVSAFGRLCWALIEHGERLYRARSQR